MVVLVGIVSNCLTVLPSDNIFHPSFKCNTSLLDDVYRFCSLYRCPILANWWAPVRECPFGPITGVYLYGYTLADIPTEAIPPENSTDKEQSTNYSEVA